MNPPLGTILILSLSSPNSPGPGCATSPAQHQTPTHAQCTSSNATTHSPLSHSQRPVQVKHTSRQEFLNKIDHEEDCNKMAKVQVVLEAIRKLKLAKEEIGHEVYWRVYRKLRWEFYKSRAWRELSQRVRKEQRNFCGICSKHGSLDVHHKKYLYEHPELALSRPNLIGLCRRCHDRIHDGTLILKEA